MSLVVISSVVKVHHALSKLNQTSFRSITFAVSMNIEHFLLSCLQSCSAFFFLRSSEFNSFKRSNCNFPLSGIKLFAFIISWVILEDGVCTKNNSLNKGSKSWVINVITNFNLVVLVILWFCHISLVDLVVSLSINGASVIEHM